MKFTFNHDDYKSPMIQNSSEEYEVEVGTDHALIVWTDESAEAYTGDLKSILKQAQEAYFNEWNDDHGFVIPTSTEALKSYCNGTELDCDSGIGFALVDISNKTVLAEPWNSRIYFH